MPTRLSRAAAMLAALACSAPGLGLAQPADNPVAPPEPVQVGSLRTLDLFTASGGDTGLGSDLWRGASAALARQVLSQLAAGRPVSPAAAALARRVLATGANAPDGAGGDEDLAAARVAALIALGDAPAADAIAKKSVNMASTPAGAQAAAEAALIQGDETRACAIAAGLKVGRDAVYWLKLRTFCQAIGGQPEAAQLTFALASEAARDPVFRRLMGVKLAGAGPPGAASLRDGLELALTRTLGLDPAPALDGASVAVAASVARSGSYAPDTRIAAAARAMRGGLTLADVFPDGQLPAPLPTPLAPGGPDPAAVATSVPVETVLAGLVKQAGVRAEGGLVSLAWQSPDPALKLRALQALLDRARTGSDVVVYARLARPVVRQLSSAGGEAPRDIALASRLAAIAGDVRATRMISDPPPGAPSDPITDALAAVANSVRAPAALGALAERGAREGPRSDAQAAVLLLMGLGEWPSADARAVVSTLEPPRGAASPAKLMVLRGAVGQRMKGEAALMVLALALDAGWAGHVPADRARIIAGLKDVGLEPNARDFTLEGLAGLK